MTPYFGYAMMVVIIFKHLNRNLDLYLGGRENKKSNRGCYIQSAKLLRAKIFS